MSTVKHMTLFPSVEPFKTGKLAVSRLHTLSYEQVGNPRGKPALFLHGGPGVGILPEYRRFFDPAFYHLVLPDQRGAGRSTPLAELRHNNTWELVEDLERLRNHLGIDRWVIMGGSWGSTLALCYAITYPDSVRGLILRGVFLARPHEIDWVHKSTGAATFYPDQYERFVSILSPEERCDPVRGYYRLLTDPDPRTRLKAARAWSKWEASIMNFRSDPGAEEEMTTDQSALAIGRIECHYTLHGFYMSTPNFLLEQVSRIRSLPCRIIQGRYDVICPVSTAWDLHRALPDSELTIIPEGGHSPLDPGMSRALVEASEDFKHLF